MSDVAEELARLGASLGETQALRAAAARLERLAQGMPSERERWDRREIVAVGAQAEALARTVFDVSRAVSSRLRSLGWEASDAGQS